MLLFGGESVDMITMKYCVLLVIGRPVETCQIQILKSIRYLRCFSIIFVLFVLLMVQRPEVPQQR